MTRLSTTPVKGLGLSHPEEIWVSRSGALGDRDFFLVDERDRLVSITKTGKLAGLVADYDRAANRLALRCPDGRTWEQEVALGDPVTIDFFGLRGVRGEVVEGPVGEELSSFAQQPLRLIRCTEPGAGSDVHPVTLLGSASVAELSRRSGSPVDSRRFRMLIEFSSTVAHIEDSWTGLTLRSDDVALRVGGPVPRCAATTRHPDRGDRDLPVVRMIKAYRGMQDTELGPGVCFGVYADVVREGLLRVGDVLRAVP